MKKTLIVFGVLAYVAIALIGANCLLAKAPAQTDLATDVLVDKVSPPDVQEAADSLRLIDAVNGGDVKTALEILRGYGIADSTLQAMSSHLNTPSSQVELKEPFLKASLGALALTDGRLKANAQANLSESIASRGYERPVWIPRPPDTRAIANYNADLLDSVQAPILVLDQKATDSCFIRYFKLYDRYADRIHSVALNGGRLNNARIHSDAYTPVSRQLNALFKLIKARNPEAFVWLSVVKQDNHSDESWLKGMIFLPDGLQILNLSQFHSPFSQTRQRYLGILGVDRPMMVSGFLGYSAAIKQQGNNLAGAIRGKDQNKETTTADQLGDIGAAGPDLAETEVSLQSLGYRGISVSWLLLMAKAHAINARPANMADLPDERIGLLDLDYDKKDYVHMLSVAEELISKSSPGDVNWIAGKLYQGIGWLKQSTPKTEEAIKTLDEVINFNFTNRLGRNHYILGVVQWRIYAATLLGDKNKIQELTQWVQNQPFPKNAKSSLLKQTTHQSKVSPVSNQKK